MSRKWISLAVERYTSKNQDRRDQAVKDRATLVDKAVAAAIFHEQNLEVGRNRFERLHQPPVQFGHTIPGFVNRDHHRKVRMTDWIRHQQMIGVRPPPGKTCRAEPAFRKFDGQRPVAGKVAIEQL